MSNPFDETLKHLVELQPEGWLRYLGVPARKAQVIDADLSTLTTAADKVVLAQGKKPFLVHIEFQTGDPRELAERTLLQNILLRKRHQLPVRSVLILLRKKANLPILNGLLRLEDPMDSSFGLAFRYQVVRVWEQSVEHPLSGALATLPLAPLANVERAKLPSVIERMKVRL